MAIVCVGAALRILATVMAQAEDQPPQPQPVDAQIVDLPPASAPQAQQPSPKPQVHPETRPNQPAMPQQSNASASNEAPARNAAAPAPAKAPTSSATSLSGGNGAQAIVHPLPKIPDDLREEAMEAAAIARFHVAADGSASVELARPTQNPRLNRLLLDTLKMWRFFPAVKNGKPVASTEEIVIKMSVR